HDAGRLPGARSAAPSARSRSGRRRASAGRTVNPILVYVTVQSDLTRTLTITARKCEQWNWVWPLCAKRAGGLAAARGTLCRHFSFLTGGLVAIVICALAGMIAFGAGNPPPPLASMNDPLEKIDFNDLPRLQTIPSHTGSPIAFREWKAASTGEPEIILILIHGSSGSSASLHLLGKALSAEGIFVYAPDIRGHGKTGRKGDIDYPQQLDDDLRTLLAEVKTRQPRSRLVLAGFSAGGGFALHAAALPLAKSFGRAVLISPMLGVRAPTVRPNGDAWVKP